MKICNKKMEYAHMELNGKMFLISAEEFSLYDKYLRYARNKDREIKIIEPEESNPLKIVYGMMLVNQRKPVHSYDIRYERYRFTCCTSYSFKHNSRFILFWIYIVNTTNFY